MNTQQDFELTAEEMAEWKTFLAHHSVAINPADKRQDAYSIMQKPDFSVLNEPSAVKDYLLQIKKLSIYLRPIDIDYGDTPKFPNSFQYLTNLEYLILGKLPFATLSEQFTEQIGQLTKLKELEIDNCDLISLPESIGQLTQLEKLKIDYCHFLTTLPESIVNLKQLTLFEVTGCARLVDIPQNIQQLPCFVCHASMSDKEEFHRKNTLEGKKVKKVLTQLKKDTSIPLIKIKAKKAKNLPLTASKFGGVPYWLPETPYPVDENGDKLVLLAQINCSELPPLPDFPTTGLQFFISTSGEVDYDNLISQKWHCVVYHEKIDDNIRQEQVLALNIPLTTQDAEDFDFRVPVVGEYGLSFTAGKSGIGLHNHNFGELFKQTAQALKITLDEEYDEAINLYDVIGKDAYNKLEESIYGHHIGGYPHFCQEDPRYDDFPEYKILLLQIDSKNGIDWGEYGVGNFFITADDLKKRDFSKVLYYWDN